MLKMNSQIDIIGIPSNISYKKRLKSFLNGPLFKLKNETEMGSHAYVLKDM